MPSSFSAIRRAGSIALFTALAAAPSARAAEAPADSSGPRIECSSTAWDFKEIGLKAPCVHVFKITNTGTATLMIINTAPSCGCTVPSMSRKAIPAGESEDLKVTYDSNRKGSFHKTVTVTSNDPVHASVVLSIEGNVVSEVDVSPQWGVRWPAPIRREDLPTSSQRITVSTSKLEELKIEKLESANASLVWKIVDGPDARTRIILLSVKPDAPAGLLSANLVIHTNSSMQPVIDVQVHAEVTGEIEVTPIQLFFRSSPDGSMLEDRFSVRDRKAKGNLKLMEIRDEGGNLELITETVKPDTQFTIRARVEPGAYKAGFFSGDITITTNRAGEEKLKVSYSGHLDAPPATTKQ